MNAWDDGRTTDSMQDIYTKDTYWQSADVDIVTQLELDEDGWKEWIHTLIRNTAGLENRIRELEKALLLQTPITCYGISDPRLSAEFNPREIIVDGCGKEYLPSPKAVEQAISDRDLWGWGNAVKIIPICDDCNGG